MVYSEMPTVFVFLIVLILRCIVVCSGTCSTVPCEFTFRKATGYSLFDMNGVSLETIRRFVIITEDSPSECFLNTSDIWNEFNLTDSPLVAELGIFCQKPVSVCLIPSEGRRYQNAISYVQFTKCNTSVSDWNHLSEATDMRVLTVLQNAYRYDNDNVATSRCIGLENSVSFVYTNNEESSPDIQDFLSCVPVYPEMAEVVFQNLSWTQFPEIFVNLFPNLQTLEIPNNNFTAPPPIFPWTVQEHYLPRNLSRSLYMAHHYSVSIDLDIEPNKYRRLYNLENNKITNLSDYAFHGYLQMIDLKGNGMVVIGEQAFQNVTGLQHLVLSNNNLYSLPVGLLRGLTNLHRLDLSANKLETLPVGLFDDVTALRYLSLANNSLKTLHSKLFTNLLQLKILHLEHNLLTTLRLDTFPVDSVVLEEVILHSNPINELPEFIFWLRNLEHADFHNTDITFDNLTSFLKNMDTGRLAESIVDSASDVDTRDIKRRSERLRIINLSGCKIKSIFLEEITNEVKVLVLVLLHHFNFVLTNNPINCDCKLLPFTNLIQNFRKNGTVAADEYYFNEWICQYPQELQNRPLMKVKDEETYCLAPNVIGCPTECKCFNRSVNNNIIVDCRNLSLISIHDTFPKGTLELWYGNNNITQIKDDNFMSRVQTLDVSFNRITTISGSVFAEARQLKQLYLQSNLLTYLPKSIENLNLLETVKLSHNNFQCDCNSLWMKHWFLRNRHVILNWNELSCSNKATGRKLTDVEDTDFVCPEEFDSIRDVIVPSVTCSVIVCVLVIAGVLVYAYRLECKVLMYVYLGIHPFDRDADPKEEYLDCVIVHSGTTTDWVMNNIVKILEGNDYRFVVCDMARDFVVGFSMQENLSGMVRHSKRIIFFMSNDWGQSNETFKLAWNISQEKIKETRLNYGIVVNHGVEAKKVTDKELVRLMKRGRLIDSSERLFVEKIIYSMPQKGNLRKQEKDQAETSSLAEANVIRQIPLSFIETVDDISSGSEPSSPGVHMHRCHAFISYCDGDTEYVVLDLQPLLESKGYRLCIADRDFIPGAPKEENILAAINASKRTLFILSKNHTFDEWSLFTFRAASEKSLREKTNHLIVIIKDDLDIDSLDKEVKHYLKTYVSLNVTDRWFEQKLFNGLPLLKHSKQLHTSPLFTTCVDMENVAFQMKE